jgi:hypothetical protein
LSQPAKQEVVTPSKSSFAKKTVTAPAKKSEPPKEPFFFYMQIRKSELKQEEVINGNEKPMSPQQLQNHVKGEWNQLTDDQQKRFLIPEEI